MTPAPRLHCRISIKCKLPFDLPLERMAPMGFRWLIALTIYTLLIGPIMDAPTANAKTKARSPNRTP